MPLIFGREPAVILALVASAVKLASAFWFHVTGDQQAVINAVAIAVVGLIVAAMTHDGISAAVLGLIQALMALALGFGLHWGSDQQAVVMSFAATLVAMFVRTQVTAPAPAPQPTPAA